MNRDDRIDDALRAMAQAEAPRDFPAQVRARIETGAAGQIAWWPRVAAAAAVMLVVVAAAWRLRETPVSPDLHVAQATAPAVLTAPRAAAPGLAPSVPPRAAPVREPVSPTRDAVARVRRATAVPSDHERALEPLSPLEAISLASVAPDAMVVVDHVIAPLAPIAPLPVREMLGDAERGEL